MRAPRTQIALLGVGLLVLLVGEAGAEQGSQSSLDPEYFRQVVYERTLAIEEALKLGHHASEQIRLASPEAVEKWFEMIGDQEKFLRASERLLADSAASGAAPDERRSQAAPIGYQAAAAYPFPTEPDYPPESGYYWTTVGSFLVDKGYLDDTGQSCDIDKWAEAFFVWEALYAARVTAEAICNAAGCDPTGIVCLLFCGAYDGVAAAEEVARVPLELCSIQDGNVEAAETRAAYLDINNARVELWNHTQVFDLHQTDLANHDASLTRHDLSLTRHDGRLGQHDLTVQSLLGQTLYALDHTVELRRVHLQVVEVKGSLSDDDSDSDLKYLVTTSVGGQPVDVEFVAVDGLTKKPIAFVDLWPQTTIAQLEQGVYVIAFDRPVRNKTVRLRVRHDDVVDHFGEVVFSR